MKYLLIKAVILYFSLICSSHSQEFVSQSDYDVVSCDDCTTTATFSEAAIVSNKLNEKIVVININTLKAMCFEISIDPNTLSKEAIVVEPFDGVEKSMKELIKLKHALNS